LYDSKSGLTGQASAIQLGVARLLCKIDKENRLVLKPFGFLTRDSRIKERKKYGLKKLHNFQNVKLLYLFTEREYAKI
jgi:ribosomal protein S9